MSRLPRNVKPQKLVKFLTKMGFQEVGGRGSHIRLKHSDGRWTQVAIHPGPVPVGTLRRIIAQAELTEEETGELK